MLKLTYIAVLDDGDTYSLADGATLQGYTDAGLDARETEQATAPADTIELSARLLHPTQHRYLAPDTGASGGSLRYLTLADAPEHRCSGA